MLQSIGRIAATNMPFAQCAQEARLFAIAPARMVRSYAGSYVDNQSINFGQRLAFHLRGLQQS